MMKIEIREKIYILLLLRAHAREGTYYGLTAEKRRLLALKISNCMIKFARVGRTGRGKEQNGQV